jgi:hypothetical protein
MALSRRITAAVAAAALALAGTGAVAQAEATHWSSAKCAKYKRNYLRLVKHPNKGQKKAVNKLLKQHGCSVRV